MRRTVSHNNRNQARYRWTRERFPIPTRLSSTSIPAAYPLTPNGRTRCARGTYNFNKHTAHLYIHDMYRHWQWHGDGLCIGNDVNNMGKQHDQDFSFINLYIG